MNSRWGKITPDEFCDMCHPNTLFSHFPTKSHSFNRLGCRRRYFLLCTVSYHTALTGRLYLVTVHASPGHIRQITIKIIQILACRYDVLCRIGTAQIQSKKHALDHADHTPPTRQRDLEHTCHILHTNRRYVLPKISIRS